MSPGGLILPTAAEERAIARGIAADEDTYEPTEEEFKSMKPFRGRPAGSGSRVSITLRLDKNVISRFRATGPGWQTRLNELLVRATQRARI
ncbi:MAG: BrnA antitoxin family protein [Steroidobacteraceae bacterium]